MRIGDYPLKLDLFPSLEATLAQCQVDSFKKQSARMRFAQINLLLLKLIQESPMPCFLLGAVIDYIDKINQIKVLDERYHFSHFEFWLNQYAEITPDHNTLIRAKIAGQYFPREDYQVFFPIGMGNRFSGTHYVAAHLSPDVDTTIASFWGWLDAFAARVSTGLHLWSLPGGPPDSPITTLFKDIFHQTIFSNAARQATTLTLNAMDLITKKNMRREAGHAEITSFDHGADDKAVILVDNEGHYMGDWRNVDVEPVRQVIILFNACLRWFETNIHIELISLFAKEHLHAKEIPTLCSSLFDRKLEECEPIQEFSEQQRQYLADLLAKVLHVPDGLKGTFGGLCLAFEQQSLKGLKQFQEDLLALGISDIFNASGEILEDRPKIFHLIQKIIQQLDNATYAIRNYMERLDVAIQIKHNVLGKTPHYLTLRNDVEEIRLRMGHYDYLTVVIPEEHNQFYPVGVVWASELRKSYLGTVSFRDFCNPEEVKMASYLSVISVVDHHKTNLKTNSPPMALIGDAQSCNVLMAEQALQMSRSVMENKGEYFIHPKREFAEYLFFLHAILDDTDLLTKVSNRDVKCVAHLLNRLKSLSEGKETEILHLNDLPRDENFAKAAAKKILQHEEMFSLYRKVYEIKEKEVSESILAFVENRPSNLFADTKIQNGCCRIGQIKIFSSNAADIQQHHSQLEMGWLNQSKESYQSANEIDLHMLMISTIPNAEEVFKDTMGTYSHRDELWFWIPDTDQAQDHLAIFLSGFQNIPEIHNSRMTLLLQGPQAKSLKNIFQGNFISLPVQIKDSRERSMAILTFRAGSINSRKSMISPFLPRLIP